MGRPVRPRRARVPYLVALRARPDRPVFVTTVDYARFLQCAALAALRYGVQLHGYALLPRSADLLLTPEQADNVSRFVQSLGRRYWAHLNQRYGREGPLWATRFRTRVLETSEEVLAALYRLETRPLTEAGVADPAAYPWSSYRVHAQGADPHNLIIHGAYLELGPTQAIRQARYTALHAPRYVAEETHAASTPARQLGAFLISPSRIAAGRRA